MQWFACFLLLCSTVAAECIGTYTEADGCVVQPDTADLALPSSAEARAEAFRVRQLELQEEERVVRHNLYRRACELSAPFIEQGIAMAREAIGDGKNNTAYPLPIAESAISTLRAAVPEDYHVHVERWEDVQELILRHAVTPNYPLHTVAHSYGRTPSAESLDYVQLIHDIRNPIPEKYRATLDDPVHLFTLYWDCTEEEFSRRRMDTWIRHVSNDFYDEVSCIHYNRCRGRYWVDDYRDWSWNWVEGYWVYYDGPWPPHPRDL